MNKSRQKCWQIRTNKKFNILFSNTIRNKSILTIISLHLMLLLKLDYKKDPLRNFINFLINSRNRLLIHTISKYKKPKVYLTKKKWFLIIIILTTMLLKIKSFCTLSSKSQLKILKSSLSKVFMHIYMVYQSSQDTFVHLLFSCTHLLTTFIFCINTLSKKREVLYIST